MSSERAGTANVGTMSEELSPAWELEELVASILQWLPPVGLLPVRLVCRSWNKVVLSQRSKASKPCCFHFFQLKREVVACRLFDPVLSAWVRVSCPRPSSPLAKLCLIRSGGNSGLVAFFEHDLSNVQEKLPPPHFWVGNPLTNKWKFVPGVEGLLDRKLILPTFNLVVAEGPHKVSFKIVASGRLRAGESELDTLIYDSTTGEWKKGASYPSAEDVARGTTTHNGCIYFANHRVEAGVSEIVCYSPEHDRFDVVTRGVVKNSIPHGVVFLEGDSVPVLPVRRHNELRFYEFHKDVDGWALKETAKADALNRGLVMSQEPVRSGRTCVKRQPDYIYVATDFDAAAMYQSDKLACKELSQPLFFKDQQQKERYSFTGQVCSFQPCFDIES